jgi:hypothetical protein
MVYLYEEQHILSTAADEDIRHRSDDDNTNDSDWGLDPMELLELKQEREALDL